MHRSAASALLFATLLAGSFAFAGSVASCGPERVVIHRDNCVVCHQPLDERGVATGLEDAHPWSPVSCVNCHGGSPRVCDGAIDGEVCSTGWIYDKERAHVPPNGSPPYIRNLPSDKLDAVDPDFLRFVNPGDYRVAEQTCGGGALGSACHAETVQGALRSTMLHTAGEIAVARYRAEKQPHARGIYGSVQVEDPNPEGAKACGVASLEVYDPPPIDVASSDAIDAPTVANAQEQYMVKSCFRCHLGDFGENLFPGDFRSSGCTACHMNYANDGLSHSADPTIDKQTAPHPVKHQLTLSPPVEQCVHCHYRGGRIGNSFQGYRESPGPGLTPANIDVLGEALHGHDANFYITDEDTTNGYDETPPDIHFEFGMHCIDCHTRQDVHGDGHLYADTQCAVTSECTDCHGTVRDYATPDPARNNLYLKDDGKLYLKTKVTGIELEVTQTRDTVTLGSPRYTAAAALAMGVDDNGYSHTDDLECYTCHASWAPNCYGCHVSIDLTRFAPYHTTGVEQPGKPAGGRRWIALHDMVLIRNTDGKIAPSMPAERFFMTLLGVDQEQTRKQGKPVSKTLIRSSPRTFHMPDGRTIAGFGQRAFNPHTTRRRSQFMACDRCHSVGDPAAPDNAVLLDITFGFGSQRFPQEACDVTVDKPVCDGESGQTTYQLDAIQTREGKPLVVIGHPDPIASRVLSLDEIARMRAVVVPKQSPIGISTPIPKDAITNPNWPFAQRVE
jgi:hypothetical protein